MSRQVTYYFTLILYYPGFVYIIQFEVKSDLKMCTVHILGRKDLEFYKDLISSINC